MDKSKELACALEAFDTAINHIPDATKMIDNVYIKYWTQDTAESGRWVTTGLMARGAAETLLSDEYREAFPQGHIVEPPNSTTDVVEPVAWIDKNKITWIQKYGDEADVLAGVSKHQESEFDVPLYTAPPSKPWVGLTDEEIQEMANDFEEGYVFLYRSFAAAIEAKLKELNT